MIYSENIDDLLSYLNIISTGVWAALIITIISIGVVVWLFERGKYDVPETKLRGIIEALWIVFSGLFLAVNKRIRKSSAQIVMVSYFACVVMFTSLFTAGV